MSIFSPDMPKAKPFDCDIMRKKLRALRVKITEIEELQNSIIARDETENHPNWIGAEATKAQWRKDTDYKRIYLELLINNFELEVMKLVQIL